MPTESLKLFGYSWNHEIMNYDIKYINTEAAIIESLLIDADPCMLDVSYSQREKKIIIQVVLLPNQHLSIKKTEKLTDSLNFYDEVIINEIHIPMEQFNANKGEWAPKHYNWLDIVLFSMAEAR